MSYRLIFTRPDGTTEQTSQTPIEDRTRAGLAAMGVLGEEYGTITIGGAKALGRAVRDADIGETVTHEPSGYQFRTEEF